MTNEGGRKDAPATTRTRPGSAWTTFTRNRTARSTAPSGPSRHGSRAGAEEERERRGEKARRDRDARAVQRPREDVPPELVRAEEVAPARRLQAAVEIRRVGVERNRSVQQGLPRARFDPGPLAREHGREETDRGEQREERRRAPHPGPVPVHAASRTPASGASASRVLGSRNAGDELREERRGDDRSGRKQREGEDRRERPVRRPRPRGGRPRPEARTPARRGRSPRRGPGRARRPSPRTAPRRAGARVSPPLRLLSPRARPAAADGFASAAPTQARTNRARNAAVGSASVTTGRT